MNIKKLAAATGITLLTAITIPLSVSALAPNCTVAASGADYTTIQGAVNDPTCTTIKVAPGSYTEDVTIDRPLTLNGAKAGSDARSRSGAESVLNATDVNSANITITADNVKVDGFTVNGPTNSGTAAFVMQTANTGETIQNNIVNNPGRAASITTSNTTFRRNLVKNNNTTSTDGFQANSTPVTNDSFTDNSFKGSVNPNSYNADITIIEGSSNITVTGNSSVDDGTLIALFKTNGATISGNTVTGAHGSSAIYVGGANSNVTVNGNTVKTAGTGVNVANDFGDGANSAVTITNNILTGNTNGIKIGSTAAASANTVTAHKNKITQSATTGVLNNGTLAVDATCNWWGAKNGPGSVGTGSGDKVSANVGFIAWYTTASLSSGTCKGGNIPTFIEDCDNSGWKNLVKTSGDSFSSKDACKDYVRDHLASKAKGDVTYTAYGLKREADFDLSTASATDKGTFKYSDANNQKYTVKVSVMKVSGSKAWFAGVVTSSNIPGTVGNWLFAEVQDGTPDQIWGSFTSQTIAQNGVNAMSNPADGPFAVTKGSLKVQ